VTEMFEPNDRERFNAASSYGSEQKSHDLAGHYATIVADPPWHYDKRGGFSWREGAPSGQTEDFLDYSTMTLPEIAALPIPALAASNAHLFPWTTQRYLLNAIAIIDGWGFKYRQLLVWAKPPTGFSLGGTFGNSTEFIVYAKRGKPATTGKVPRDWWEWSRAGHSVKPEAFLDLVEATCPGPYLEMFSRRARLGWQTWGDQALHGTELVA
jgi:N6-adenosine-specific RNA methylase IME4